MRRMRMLAPPAFPGRCVKGNDFVFTRYAP